MLRRLQLRAVPGRPARCARVGRQPQARTLTPGTRSMGNTQVCPLASRPCLPLVPPPPHPALIHSGCPWSVRRSTHLMPPFISSTSAGDTQWVGGKAAGLRLADANRATQTGKRTLCQLVCRHAPSAGVQLDKLARQRTCMQQPLAGPAHILAFHGTSQSSVADPPAGCAAPQHAAHCPAAPD